MQLLDLKGQCVAYKEEIDNTVSDMVESGVFIGGEKTAPYEKELGCFKCNY